MNRITVKMGDVQAAHNPSTLETHGVGSCVVIILYDAVARVGGMAHAMLPGHRGAYEKQSENRCRYVDDAIDVLLEKLGALGAQKKRLAATLIGGAEMFALYTKENMAIGRQNIASAREKLSQEKIPIRNEETGGTIGRSVTFDLVSGVCTVHSKV